MSVCNGMELIGVEVTVSIRYQWIQSVDTRTIYNVLEVVITFSMRRMDRCRAIDLSTKAIDVYRSTHRWQKTMTQPRPSLRGEQYGIVSLTSSIDIGIGVTSTRISWEEMNSTQFRSTSIGDVAMDKNMWDCKSMKSRANNRSSLPSSTLSRCSTPSRWFFRFKIVGNPPRLWICFKRVYLWTVLDSTPRSVTWIRKNMLLFSERCTVIWSMLDGSLPFFLLLLLLKTKIKITVRYLH